MPIYVFKCHTCGHTKEKLTTAKAKIICTKCGETMTKQVSLPGYRRDHTIRTEQ